VTQLTSAPQFLLVHRSVPAKTVPELVALAKKHAGKLNAGSSGMGSSNHLAIEMLKQAAGIDVAHVAYKGSGPATIALMSGEVDFSFAGSIVAMPYITAGKVRALAITSLKRSPSAPDVPTVASYYPGFEATNWFALFAPAGTPAPIVNRMSTDTAAAVKSSEVRDFLAKDGAEAVGSTPEQLGAYFRLEVARYAKVSKAANLRVE
jgi:tripartite-type tricarboxylate transporter receptor subunit TctC